jgi:SAM-dependent methyltransferase
MKGYSYRNHFACPDKALKYERVDLAGYSEILWQIEREFLKAFMARFRSEHQRIDMLDFACGTGRIILFMEEFVDSSVGVDVSRSMLDIAATKVARSTLVCRDLTMTAPVANERYDLITAFRFVLNAEPDLRLAAFRAMVARLKNRSSRLIFNNHGNPVSHRVFTLPVQAAPLLLGPHQNEGNFMTHNSVKNLLNAVGLEIEQVYGYGLLGARISRMLGGVRARALEVSLAGRPLLGCFGVNQLYVVRLKA